MRLICESTTHPRVHQGLGLRGACCVIGSVSLLVPFSIDTVTKHQVDAVEVCARLSDKLLCDVDAVEVHWDKHCTPCYGTRKAIQVRRQGAPPSVGVS